MGEHHHTPTIAVRFAKCSLGKRGRGGGVGRLHPLCRCMPDLGPLLPWASTAPLPPIALLCLLNRLSCANLP